VLLGQKARNLRTCDCMDAAAVKWKSYPSEDVVGATVMVETV
jgi:hypothetical protein